MDVLEKLWGRRKMALSQDVNGTYSTTLNGALSKEYLSFIPLNGDVEFQTRMWWKQKMILPKESPECSKDIKKKSTDVFTSTSMQVTTGQMTNKLNRWGLKSMGNHMNKHYRISSALLFLCSPKCWTCSKKAESLVWFFRLKYITFISWLKRQQ